VELGRAKIALCAMLRGGEEKLRAGLTLADQQGFPAAQLQLSFHAQEVLRAAWWAVARREHMHVRVHDVSLSPQAFERAAAGGALFVWARVSFAGVLPDLATPETVAHAGRIRFSRAFEVWLGKHSEPAARLEQALRSPDGFRFRVEIFARRAGGLAGTDELHLGTAALGLREILRAGGDLVHGALPLLDTRGSAVGEVRVSILAREVSSALFGHRSWRAEAVGIALHGLELEGAGDQAEAAVREGPYRALEGTHSSVRIEIDFLASVKDNWSSQPKPVPADGSGKVRLEESWNVPLGQGEPALAAVRAALASVEEQDSDVYFILFGAGAGAGARKGQEKELGTAHVNLEAMVKRGADVSRARLPVLDPQRRRVAWLTVSVEALEALGWVAAGGGGEKLTVGVTIGSVLLSAVGQRQLGATVLAQPMCVEVELPAQVPAFCSEAKRLSAQGRLTLEYSGQAEIVPGSQQHMGMLDALAADAPLRGKATVRLLSARASDAGPGSLQVEIASAQVPLLSLLEGASGVTQVELYIALPSPEGAPPGALLGTVESGTQSVEGAHLGTVEIAIRSAELSKAARQAAAARLLHAARVRVPMPVSPLLPDPPATASVVAGGAAARRPSPEGFSGGCSLSGESIEPGMYLRHRRREGGGGGVGDAVLGEAAPSPEAFGGGYFLENLSIRSWPPVVATRTAGHLQSCLGELEEL
jgi:hypothetical protein